MNSLDSMMSFDTDANPSKSAVRSRPGNRESGSVVDRRDGEAGLNFSQMLVDREERAEKSMSSNHQPNTEKSPENIAEGEPQKQGSSETTEGSTLTEAKPANNSLPAIVAQSLAVQAQISAETSAVNTDPIVPESAPQSEQAVQTVEAMLASIKEVATKSPATTTPSTNSPATHSPATHSPAKSSVSAGELVLPNSSGGSTEKQSVPVVPQADSNPAAAAAINEIEEVIQGLLDEDADLKLPMSGSKPNQTTTPKTQPLVVPTTAQTTNSGAKSIVSESQIVGENDEAQMTTPGASDAKGDQAFDQPTSEQQLTQNQNLETVENQSGDPSGEIALDSVEHAAPTPESAVRTPMATADRASIDVNVARQVRQQVVQQMGSRIPNVVSQEKLTINLNPDSLGQVEVTFEPKGDRLMVMILATDRMAEAALRDDVKELTDRIVERSGRFNQVEIKIELKDGAEARQEGKQNDKNEERQGQKRDQQQKEDSPKGRAGFANAESLETRQAWQSALDWQLREETELQTVSEEK